MLRSALCLAATAIVLVVTPVAGAVLAGRPLGAVLRFPPRPGLADPAGFSWPVFLGGSAIAVAALAALVVPLVRARAPWLGPARGRLPPWTAAGLVMIGLGWTLAWTRAPWAEPAGRHAFSILWLGAIVTINALAHWRFASSLLTESPGLLGGLFLASVPFWWLFEHYNQILGNWRYIGVGEPDPVRYALLGSRDFSTVLPAVLSTAFLIARMPRVREAFANRAPLPPLPGRALALGALAAGVGGLLAVGWAPGVSYPLVWVAPALAALGLRRLAGLELGVEPLHRGDWRVVAVPALAALGCGVLWELWNHGARVKWEYAVPYVDRFRLFEMPALGYAGYLPFGLCCALAVAYLPRGARRVHGICAPGPSSRGPRAVC